MPAKRHQRYSHRQLAGSQHHRRGQIVRPFAHLGRQRSHLARARIRRRQPRVGIGAPANTIGGRQVGFPLAGADFGKNLALAG